MNTQANVGFGIICGAQSMENAGDEVMENRSIDFFFKCSGCAYCVVFVVATNSRDTDG